jgi:DNA-binding XRE family transcriptional regulator
MSLKDNIKKYRSSAGLILAEAAQKIGVSKQTVQKYEGGIINNIPSNKIEEMAKRRPLYLHRSHTRAGDDSCCIGGNDS